MKNTQDQVIELAQKCLSEVPVVVLGSGASRQYGVGGMDELGACLRKNVIPDDRNGERAVWDKFVADIETNGDLENALHRVTLPSSLESRVVEETRKLLLADDQGVFGRIADGSLKLTLAQLLRHLLRTANPHIVAVTTNYDRLAEYAADQANVPHQTGYSHGYWRTFSDFSKSKSAWFGGASKSAGPAMRRCRTPALLPSRIRITEPKQRPDSATVNFWDEWSAKGRNHSGIADAVLSWRRQSMT